MIQLVPTIGGRPTISRRGNGKEFILIPNTASHSFQSAVICLHHESHRPVITTSLWKKSIDGDGRGFYILRTFAPAYRASGGKVNLRTIGSVHLFIWWCEEDKHYLIYLSFHRRLEVLLQRLQEVHQPARLGGVWVWWMSYWWFLGASGYRFVRGEPKLQNSEESLWFLGLWMRAKEGGGSMEELRARKSLTVMIEILDSHRNKDSWRCRLKPKHILYIQDPLDIGSIV